MVVVKVVPAVATEGVHEGSGLVGGFQIAAVAWETLWKLNSHFLDLEWTFFATCWRSYVVGSLGGKLLLP